MDTHTFQKLKFLIFILSAFNFSNAFGQVTNYTGKYEIKEGPGGELEVLHKGSFVSMVYRGDTYESELSGSTITGYAKQPRNYVGEYAECYDRVMADAANAKAFRKHLTIAFNENEILGTVKVPRFKCNEDDSIEIIPGDAVILKLNYRANDLVWITRDKILKMNVNKPEEKTILISGLSKGRNITIDQDDDLIFYQDGDDIWTANLDGGNKKKIISAEEGTSMVHFAVDDKNNVLLWSENYYIYRFDYPDGNIRRKPITERLPKPPFWITVDTDHEKVYWSSNYTDIIYRSNYTGRDREEFTSYKGKYVSIDMNSRNLYCAGYTGVKKINLDSRKEEEVVSASKLRERELNGPLEFVFDNEFGRLYFIVSHKFYKIAKNRDHQILDSNFNWIHHVAGYSFMSNKPVTSNSNRDNDFNIWTLIRQ